MFEKRRTLKKRESFQIDESLFMRNIYINVDRAGFTYILLKETSKVQKKGRRTLGPQCTEYWTDADSEVGQGSVKSADFSKKQRLLLSGCEEEHDLRV